MSEVNNVGLNAFLAQQYAPKQSEKIPTPASTEKVKSEPSKNADERALEKRQADANIANAAIDKRLETVRLDSQRLEETLSAKATEAA
jgi:hypothetical protein